MDTIKNYYDVLAIDSKSDLETIKKAFRTQIAIYHPDKNTSPEASEIFEDLVEGFDILSNAKKRKVYDKMLSDLSNRELIVIEPKIKQEYQEWQKEAKTKSKKYKSSTLEDLLLLDLFIGADLLDGLFDGVGDVLGDVFDLF